MAASDIILSYIERKGWQTQRGPETVGTLTSRNKTPICF